LDTDSARDVFIVGGDSSAAHNIVKLDESDSYASLGTENPTSEGGRSIAVLSTDDFLFGSQESTVRIYKGDLSSGNDGEDSYDFTNGDIYALCIDENDDVYLGTKYSTGSQTRLAKLDVDTTAYTLTESWTAATDADIYCIVEDPNTGDIYVCGDATGSYSIWKMDTSDGSLTGFVDTGTDLKKIAFRPNVGAGGIIAPGIYGDTRVLVAAGNNEVWYESTAGTMTKVADSADDVDTSEQLIMFSGFQKAFIANGTNLKVLDLISVKLTHTDLATPHAHGDVLTQDQTGGKYAYMVVDYTDGTSGGADNLNTYGYAYYAGGATAFVTATNITGSGSGSTFQATAVTNFPHWHDWTVYPLASMGTMPAQAALGCLYRGRCVLTGNPREPFQWWMSRLGNPYDWEYAARDALAAVAGANAEAGKIGDITKALIPYGDSYLLFGGVSTISILRGDPAIGGTIGFLSKTTGVFGANSWCWDEKGNLFFWGTGGIYVIPKGLGEIENLTAKRLPNIVTDESVSPDTHRITLAYDRLNMGILVFITTLATGANSNYWYDLRTGGFFPESYDDECAVYSAFQFQSATESYRRLMLGCRDGFIRVFDKTQKYDDATVTGDKHTINSEVLFSPLSLSENPRRKGKVKKLTFISGGGGTAGSESDSDGFTCNMYAADTAEEVIEKCQADGELHTFTVSGPGKSNTKIKRMRGLQAGIQVENTTENETWALEKIDVEADIVVDEEEKT